jgi:hypothetical protein
MRCRPTAGRAADLQHPGHRAARTDQAQPAAAVGAPVVSADERRHARRVTEREGGEIDEDAEPALADDLVDAVAQPRSRAQVELALEHQNRHLGTVRADHRERHRCVVDRCHVASI